MRDRVSHPTVTIAAQQRWLQATLAPVAVAVFLATLLVSADRRDYPLLHTALDTAMFVLCGLLSFMLWDMGIRLNLAIKQWMATAFTVCALFELMHVLANTELTAAFSPTLHAADALRPSTWGAIAYLLPIGLASSLRWHDRSKHAARFAGALLFLGAALLVIFYLLPPYAVPSGPGISRPTLIFVPVLWAGVAIAYFRYRAIDRILPTVFVTAAMLCIGSSCMLFSRSPNDAPALLAHICRVAGYLTLLMALLRLASTDMLVRIQTETALARLNDELEDRVTERTRLLEAANDGLLAEMSVRRQAELESISQLQRLQMLNHVTRAIGERQDLPSIFRAVIGSVENNLPIDFGCICLQESERNELTVVVCGGHADELSQTLSLTEQSKIPITERTLLRCAAGELIYEPDIANVDAPFPKRLYKAGLRAAVLAPLRTENQFFGVLIVARREAGGFSATDCEFLRQLCEHVALAAHQSQLYLALQRAYEDLRDSQRVVMQQERLRVLGQMASGVAHDINNAISPVTLYTDALLKHETGLSERAQGFLKIIKRAITDVAKTVSRMRDFCRARESGREFTTLDLDRIVDEVIELTRVRWTDVPQEHGTFIEVRKERANNPVVILGVESEIRDALTNLLLNAVDALPEGGIITVKTQLKDGRHAQLAVSDNGVGMDETTRQRCLEPFYTTKGERGTGLGLAMVFGMVQRHEATIDIESAPSRGTTIRLTFPIGSAAAALNDPPDLPAAATRILIIDDDPVVLEAVCTTLTNDGHRVTAVDGGQAGIDVFTRACAGPEPFEFVISDLGMPYVDGRRVASAVKAVSPGTPVVLLTGWGQHLLAENTLPAHVDRVISKPPTLHDLRSALNILRRAM